MEVFSDCSYLMQKLRCCTLEICTHLRPEATPYKSGYCANYIGVLWNTVIFVKQFGWNRITENTWVLAYEDEETKLWKHLILTYEAKETIAPSP